MINLRNDFGVSDICELDEYCIKVKFKSKNAQYVFKNSNWIVDKKCSFIKSNSLNDLYFLDEAENFTKFKTLNEAKIVLKETQNFLINDEDVDDIFIEKCISKANIINNQVNSYRLTIDGQEASFEKFSISRMTKII